MRKEVRAVSDGKSPAEIPHMRIGESEATTTRLRHSVNSMLLIASVVMSMALVGCMSLEERLASSDAKIKKDAEIAKLKAELAKANGKLEYAEASGKDVDEEIDTESTVEIDEEQPTTKKKSSKK